MKYKHIMWVFGISLIAGIVIRTCQALFITDAQTGFIKPEYKMFGILMTALICLAAIVCIIVGLTVRRCPQKMPKVTPLGGIGSMLLGAFVFAEVAFILFETRLELWQAVALEVFGFLSGVFFIAYGLKAFVKYKLPGVFFAVPVVFWAVKLIKLFTSISSIALIAENIVLCLGCCAALVFMLEYAKLANNINIDRTSRYLLASGLCASNLSLVYAVPELIEIIGRISVLKNKYAMSVVLKNFASDIVSTASVLVTGIFVLLFVVGYFSTDNLSRRHSKHHRKRRFMPSSGEENNFYLGSSHRKQN